MSPPVLIMTSVSMSAARVVPMAAALLLLCRAAICDVAINDCPKNCECLGAYVDCSQKLLDRFPNSLPPWTEDLDLSSNRIRGLLKIDTDGILNLTTLKLNKNFIKSFPSFIRKTGIHHLNLAHNKIDKLDGIELENLPNLRFLDMNKNKLTFLEASNFPLFNHLRILNLNNNFISNLSGSCLDRLTHLLELKISHNRLTNLPNGLFKNLGNLELLDLSKNHLTVIEGLLFKDLSNLKTMILRRNNIEDLLDGSFYGLANLQLLHMEGNSLSKISKGWLYGMNSLIYLNISYNKIDQIKGGWEYCPELEELDLSYNKLNYIEKNNLENLRKLQKLHLSNNRLSFVEEGSFNNTPLLKMLNMDHNHLSWMIEDSNKPFNSLKNLKKLSLVDNKILYVKKEAFCGLSNLDELNLLQNNVLEIQELALKCMPNLVYLYLNSTSLVCDCSLAWVKQPNILEHLPFDFINVLCGFPEKNRGKSLDEIPLTDFLCLESSPKPTIVFHPESKMVLEGQNTSLKCGVNSSSSLKIHFIWKKDNHDLEMISANHYSSYEFNGVTHYSILYFYNMSMTQSGKYQCVASNEFGITYSNRSILSVVIFPFFTKEPGNDTIKIGDTAKLECAASGYPTPQISWQKDGGNDFPAAQDRRMKVMSKDDVFLIVNVKLVDMGIYSCTAKNVAGIIAANATLTVLESPWYGSIILKKQVKVGEQVVLECLSYGTPKPRIKWTKDGIPLTTSNRHHFTTEDQLLIIMETNTDDSGTYQCKMNNSLGIKIQETEVLILPLYQSIFDKYALWVIVVAVIVCIVITSTTWIFFVCRARRSSSNLLNNVDNKSLSSSNSKDSGTGESTKRSQELYNECLNVCQELNKIEDDVSPEITLPLISNPTVILGENSVTYKNSKTTVLPVQSPKPWKNTEDPTKPCSTPICSTEESQCSSKLVEYSNSNVCLDVPTENQR